MYDTTKVTNNYGDYDGNDWWVEGTLHVTETGNIDFKGNELRTMRSPTSLPNPATVTTTDLAIYFNDIVFAIKESGLMQKAVYTANAVEAGTPSAMPTPETAANSEHISSLDVSDDNVITITLDCKVDDLEVADHGETWGKHKWLGFGVVPVYHFAPASPGQTKGIYGIEFIDATGASVTLSEADIDEATALGIENGFVLYIKAEDARYLHDGRKFWLTDYGPEGRLAKKTEFTIKLIEAEE